ncbi:hypothetical protein ACFL54_09110 [Planctomycetota bacterium]
MEQCQFCGSNNVRQLSVNHMSVLECQLCGEYSGPSDGIEIMRDLSNADQRGIDLDIYPLVKLLESINGFRVSSATSGDADLLIPPFVAFTVQSSEIKWLEKLLSSLRHIADKCHTRWIIQVTMQKQLTFEMKPNFAVLGDSLNRFDIRHAIEDLPMLEQTLARDMHLSWWNK